MPLHLLGAATQSLSDYKAIYVQETAKIQTNNAVIEEAATTYLKALDRVESDVKKAGDTIDFDVGAGVNGWGFCLTPLDARISCQSSGVAAEK